MESRFEQLVTRVKTLQREIDRATGALDVAKKKLKEDFNLSSLKEAKERYRELTAEVNQAEQEFEKDLDSFEKEWVENERAS
jgi:capsule polysaccharide export protein KpsE/RkpR